LLSGRARAHESVIHPFSAGTQAAPTSAMMDSGVAPHVEPSASARAARVTAFASSEGSSHEGSSDERERGDRHSLEGTTVPRFPKSHAIDDATLARFLAAEDPRAFAALWDKYATLVRGLLRRMLGPGADVDDLVQDAFIGLARTLPGLRDPNALRSFVVGTALRVARSELRRRRVRRCLFLTPTGAVPEKAQEGASNPEARRAVTRLYELLDEIDDRSRMAFVLRHIEGYELTEVASSLGCALATAKRVLTRVDERVNAIAKRDPLLAAYVRGAHADETRDETRDETDATPDALQ
jgi:RNA polymerase sigma-70 factor (ECF subfamily)